MKSLCSLLIFSGIASAQATAIPAPTVNLPSNWYGAFGSYNSSSSPKLAAGATEASLLSKSAQVYTYNTWDVTLIKVGGKWTYQTAPRTGLAMILRKFGPFYVVGFGNIGAAMAASNASLATSGGGMVIWQIGKTQWTLFGGYHVLNSGALGGTVTVPEAGFGRTF